MNKYWPKGWKKSLPNFLGEDFFDTFENLDMNMESDNTNNQPSQTNQQANQSTSSPSSIKVDVYESGHELLCICRLPGLKLKEVEIDVYDMTLEITGNVSIDYKEFRPIYQEIYKGPVQRKIKLPYPVRHDQVDASYHHGHLFIHLHRLIRLAEKKTKVNIDDLD